MKIALGTDHAGYCLKEKIKSRLEQAGHTVQDFGCFSQDACDYPLFIQPVARAVQSGEVERGIVFGGSGNGEAMSANRYPGVRCALCWSEESALLSRAHNDANILSLGARLVPEEQAFKIVDAWLDAPYEGGRHERRIRLIDEL